MAEVDDDDSSSAEVEVLDPVTFAPNAALAAAIKNGDVTTKTREVEVKAKDKDGNVTKVYRQSYTQCVAKNETGALALPGVDGDEEKIWDFVSSKADANSFQNVYVKLRNLAAGPEKIVNKIAKLLADLPESQRELAMEKFRAAGIL